MERGAVKKGVGAQREKEIKGTERGRVGVVVHIPNNNEETVRDQQGIKRLKGMNCDNPRK